MTIIILPRTIQIKVEDNKILTKIVKMVDGTSLAWHVYSDHTLLVVGERELLFDLLLELTRSYFGKIEII